MSEAPMLVVGLMSGTSLDGVDAVLVRIAGPTKVELLGFAHRAYNPAERAQIEAVLRGAAVSTTAHLHVALAEWAAEAVDVLLASTHVRADALAAIVFPGQTLWHEPPRVTWQLGEPAVLAERFGVRVISNLRARDVAAGGQGAPLVPMADALLFAATDHPRILLNLGGMANVSWVPPRGGLDDVVGADTGPGMAIIDALARRVAPGLPFDVDGALARAGRVDPLLLTELLAEPFFSEPPPRSTGRERFGADYAERLALRSPGSDGVRTAVELTMRSIIDCCEQFLPSAREVVVAGGGSRHPVLMARLTEEWGSRGVSVERFDDHYFASEAKEAVAFALLGWLTIHGQPGNLPSVTGASGPRVLGCITPA
jgi:anhydro-N-acetylmuramic acid kinase